MIAKAGCIATDSLVIIAQQARVWRHGWPRLTRMSSCRQDLVGLGAAGTATAHLACLIWNPSFPLDNTKSPHPENPDKLLKNYNLAHPNPVLKITEKLPKTN